ncbi:MAG: hypothetical protein U0Q47_00030, partial [Mycobacterium sp.]
AVVELVGVIPMALWVLRLRLFGQLFCEDPWEVAASVGLVTHVLLTAGFGGFSGGANRMQLSLLLTVPDLPV